MINRRSIKNLFAWLSFGLIILTLTSSIISVSPTLHELVHDHAHDVVDLHDEQDSHNHEEPNSEDPVGACLACSLASGSIDFGWENPEPLHTPSLFQMSFLLESSFGKGDVSYLFPLSQAPPIIA